ncbi:TIGR01777 family oxidoreductase [Thiorhodospira sibirica]|uniref:TIGR01777 family oxidoreductase n=1 Tax=Thiorhodospira sibirica TaxID=154347 RepID=UPI00022C39E9|nr:TIGR01777 family oxidoreductase [Thiorhodospira sibirica]
MKILITGGTGFIGRHLANRWAAQGHAVIVLSRQAQAPGAAGLHPQVRILAWDGVSAQGWGSELEGADAIVNLAGANIAGEGLLPTRWSAERKDLITRSRVAAGQAVVQAITAATVKPRVLLQASGIDYYAAQPSMELPPVNEDSPRGEGFLAEVCAQWEQATAPVEILGVRRVIMRTGVVLSDNGGALPRMALPFRFFAGGTLGNGQQPVSWIHLEDQLGAIEFLLAQEAAHGAFNLCAPHPLSNAAFMRELGRALHRPALLPAPALALKLALGEMSTLLLSGRRALPQRLLDMGYVFRYPTADTALAALYAP